MFAALAAISLITALVLDIIRAGGAAPAGVAAIVFLGLAVAFPRWPPPR